VFYIAAVFGFVWGVLGVYYLFKAKMPKWYLIFSVLFGIVVLFFCLSYSGWGGGHGM